MWIHTRTVKRRNFGIVYWPLLRTVYFCFSVFIINVTLSFVSGECVRLAHISLSYAHVRFTFFGSCIYMFFVCSSFVFRNDFVLFVFSSNLNLFNLFWFVIHIVNDLVFSLFFVFFHKVSVFVLSSFVCSFFFSLFICLHHPTTCITNEK